MNKIFFNTIKIAFSAIVAIIIALILELDFYISAGIVTILTIQSTKRETMITAIERFYAFMIALVIAYMSFFVFGFDVLAFGVYLVVYILVCQYKKWYSSMAVNSVLISHFLTFQSFSIDALLNEIGLFVIGVSIGILANMHLHKNVDYMNELKQKSDNQIKYILLRMSKRIVNKVDDYDGNCFDELNDLITQAKTVSIENENNVLWHKDSFDKEYIKMREHQTQVLYEMYKTIRKMYTTPLTAHIISEFLEKIANEYSIENDCELLLEEFYCIDQEMKSVPLPKMRKEFEDRARLFSLLRLIEEFLQIKNTFSYKIYEENN